MDILMRFSLFLLFLLEFLQKKSNKINEQKYFFCGFKEILKKRFEKLDKHYVALKEYKHLIDNLQKETNIFDQFSFNTLKPEKRAILDAYLKRFASIQDFLGAKIFSPLLEIAGINNNKMSLKVHLCLKGYLFLD